MFSYENQGSRSYLVYTLEDGETIDTMSLGMITNNQIAGLIPALFIQTDSVKTIKYNVSSRVPVKQVFSGRITKARLLGVFNGIADALLACEDYMIDPATLVFDLDHIFTDVSEYKTELVCVPTSGIINSAQSPLSLLKHVMFSYTFDESENSAYVTRIINFLNSSVNFSAAEFKKMLQEIKAGANPPRPAPQTPAAPPTGHPSAGTGYVSEPPMPGPSPPIGNADGSSYPAGSGRHPGPDVPPPKTSSPQDAGKTDNGEKMSLFYLLRHFDSENLAKYRAQKGDKSGGKEETGGKKGKEKGGKKGGCGGDTPYGFHVPGDPEGHVAPPIQSGGGEFHPAPENPPVGSGIQSYPPRGNIGIPGTYIPDEQPTGDGGGTVVFPEGENSALRPILVRKKNNERIPIEKEVFCIGSQEGYADYCIRGNKYISRSHANIVTKDGEYFIVDTNSKNHTFVNGEMIQSNVEVKISHGTVIRLGDETFDFLLM